MLLAFPSPLTILGLGFALIMVLILIPVIGTALARRRRLWIYRTNRRPGEFKRAQRGAGLGLDALYERTKLAARTLRETTPRYTKVAVPKRRGGHRLLLVPDDTTKDIQRRILRRLLQKLRAHDAAVGFERGRSIVDHARPHVGQALVVTMDVKDFFTRTTSERVDAYFRRVGWNADVAALLTRWTTFDGGLPQGAPTSPRLSNLVNTYLDVQLATVSRLRGAAYTRYADDICLSFARTSPRKVRGTMQRVRRVLSAHGYEAHGKRKTKIQPSTRRQVVTGLVVNQKVNLPRRTRRWLRSVRHHQATGRPMTITDRQLEGWTAFERMVTQQRGR